MGRPNLIMTNQSVRTGDIDPSCTISVTVAVTAPTTEGGSDGKASANVSKSQGNVTYLWSNSATTPSITGLVQGLYSVTVTDAGGTDCTAFAEGFVKDPVDPIIPACNLVLVSLTPTAPNVSGGSDGSVQAVFSGNTGAVSILWDDGQEVNPAIGLSEGAIGMVGIDSGVGDSCKVVGSTIVPQGTLDNAMFFDAINDHATSSTDVVMSGAFLFQTEFEYTNAISFTRLISSSNSNYINITDSTTIVTRATGSTRIFTVAAMSSATKHHLVVRRDASYVVNVFVDGVKYASGASTILGAFTFNRISGVTGNFSMFGGKLKNLGLVTGDFSDTVVANLFADPSTFVAEVGTCSFYEMNQDNDLEQMVDTGGDDINYHTFGYAVGAPKFVAW